MIAHTPTLKFIYRQSQNSIMLEGCLTHNLETAVTIGFFDGVHRGHRFLLNELKDKATRRGLQPLVVTFDSKGYRVLTTLAEKTELIKKLGIGRIEVLEFDDRLKHTTAFDFMKHTLKECLNAKMLLVGFDNRFGFGLTDGIEEYRQYGKALDIEVEECSEFPEGNEKQHKLTCSTHIKQLLADGDVAQVAKLLGYPYFVRGTVVRGKQLGRTIGFPTVNLGQIDENKLIPNKGAYAGAVNGKRAIINVGDLIEAHILDFDGNLYGENIQVNFERKLRDEMKFASVDELKQQLTIDKARCAL